MTLLIKTLYAVLLTSFTGSVTYGAWWCMSRLLRETDYFGVLFEALKGIAVFFLVPFGFIYLLINPTNIGNGYLFMHTPFIYYTGNLFCLIWGVGALWNGFRCVKAIYDIRTIKRNAFEVEAWKQELFQSVCEKMGIQKGKVLLGQSWGCAVPCVIGVWKQMIVLPVGEYSEKELQVIFTHELTHHRQKDVFLKWISIWVRSIHFFNPVAWKFCRDIQKWSEFACDYRSCTMLGSRREYFGVIAEIATEASWNSNVLSQLTESKNELIERMERMKGSKRHYTKWMVALLSMLAVVTSTITVCAATVGSAELYVQTQHATAVTMELEMETTLEPVVYEDAGFPERVNVQEGEVETLSRSAVGFEWTMNTNGATMTPGFYCSAGSVINVNVFIEPDNAVVNVGIILPNGTRQYVRGVNRLINDFDVTTSGIYKVFVENNSGATIEVEGNYMVH